MQLVTNEERRARLARRQALAPGHGAASVEAAAERMLCLHATDPSTIALSAWARVEGFTIAELERAMYDDRTLIKHMAMRRTLFVFPRDALGVAQAGASARVAGQERGRLVREIERSGVAADGEAWFEEAAAAVVADLGVGHERTSTELKGDLPILQSKVQSGSGKWATEMVVAPRMLTALQAAGAVVRGHNNGSWNAPRPRWSAMTAWLGEPLEVPSFEDGVAGLVERWLRVFGPGTTTDIKWWLGGTVAATKQALSRLEAVEVGLEGGSTGWLLPDDLEPEPAVEPWGAVLPGLDPTPMGWKERDWYLGDYKPQIFDSVGNAGPTIWWDGRIVGGWRQDADATVDLLWLEDVGSDARAVLEAQAARLTEWLDGVKVLPRFPSPLSKTAAPR